LIDLPAYAAANIPVKIGHTGLPTPVSRAS